MERKAYNHIDLIRAVLILMVILVHIVHFGTLYPRIREVIFVFFMPTFLLLTGYLTNVRKNVREFTLYELRILLPYCIMVTAFASLSLVLPVRDGLTELTPPHTAAHALHHQYRPLLVSAQNGHMRTALLARIPPRRAHRHPYGLFPAGWHGHRSEPLHPPAARTRRFLLYLSLIHI